MSIRLLLMLINFIVDQMHSGWEKYKYIILCLPSPFNSWEGYTKLSFSWTPSTCGSPKAHPGPHRCFGPGSLSGWRILLFRLISAPTGRQPPNCPEGAPAGLLISLWPPVFSQQSLISSLKLFIKALQDVFLASSASPRISISALLLTFPI